MADVDNILKDLLESNTIVGGLEGQKILLYGGGDTGKSSQSAKFNKPFLLMTESGGNALRCPKKAINKFTKFKEWVELLTSDKSYDKFYKEIRTVIIDTAENLVDLSEQATCAEFGVRDLSEIQGKQNGWKISRRDFSMQINKLTSSGYTVIFIAHEEEVEKVDEETGEIIVYKQPKGTSNEKSSMRLIRDLCDFTIYLKANGVDTESQKTIPSTAICKETKRVFARSRYSCMPTFVKPFNAKNIIEAMEKAIIDSAEIEGGGLSTFVKQADDYTLQELISLIKPYFSRLYKLYPQNVEDIVSNQLSDKKISSATEDDKVALEVIYGNLISLACDRGIVVETE